MVTIVKRKGHRQQFDEKKAYASIYAACMECSLGAKLSEGISQDITAELKRSLKGRSEVNSTEIFGFIVQKLAKANEAVAFMYATHREMPKA
jgi:transcriptional regulator NrdR family protein